MSRELRSFLASLSPEERASAIYGLFIPPDLGVASITVSGGCQAVQMAAAWPEVRAALGERKVLLDRLAGEVREGLDLALIESTIALIDGTYRAAVLPILRSDFERTLALHRAHEEVFGGTPDREPDA